MKKLTYKQEKKLHNADMKKIDKQLAEEINQHDMETIEQRFSDLIREKMNDKQFWHYVAGWKDQNTLCDEMEDWFDNMPLEEQKREIKEAREVLKFIK
jgi:hypothetical protein